MTSINDSKLFYIATGKNIKKYRDLRNYSLQALADKVGLTKKTIQRYENGDIKINMNRLKDLAIALDVSVNKLTEGTNAFFGDDPIENKNPNPLTNEKEFVDKIDLTDEELIKQFTIEVDGRQLSEKEMKKVIEQVRLDRRYE